jgi:8-oxoguanine deaminase
MGTLLVRNAHVLVTMDAQRRELAGGGLFARDGVIEQVGPTDELPDTADTVLDARDHVVLPGLVNTHHHLYQSLTRAVPGAQDAGLFGWLTTLYPIWGRLTPEHLRLSTQVGLAELALSGCTTTADHLYLFPDGTRLDDTIEAAREVGVRLHASRGSMSLGESDGGLPPDDLVEGEDAILDDCQRVIEAHHDPAHGAMTRVVVAPCSPFSVTPDLMRESAALARTYGVHLHTHLAETLDEEAFCLERHGARPVAHVAELGWHGPDVWFAHAVHVDDAEVAVLAARGSGVAHCPSSNMRLASGTAPVRAFLDAGVRVGLGVDGSASNDGAHLLGEARQAMLVARLGSASDARHRPMLTAREALEVATRGGAEVLGRDDVGALEVGRCADLVALDLRQVGFAGALHDPVAATVLCAPTAPAHVVVHGRTVVRDGALTTVDLPRLVAAHNRAAANLLRR